jgi:MoCo/4Fe-4S cofactor protein with predicted Tat translocation signal
MTSNTPPYSFPILGSNCGCASGSSKPKYWRSLDELANTPEFRQFVEDEFPDRAAALQNPTTRRTALRSLAGALALAGLSGCSRQPEERIIPYVEQPESIIPGRPLSYATAMPFRGSTVGLLVESHEGRPTKVEGNELHPGSLGATSAFHQASIRDLYDGRRSQTVLREGQTSTWEEFAATLTELRAGLGTGAGFHILSEPLHSPTLLAQRAELRAAFPGLEWYEFDPVSALTGAQAASRVAGRPVETVYSFDRCQVILSLDSDFLFDQPGSLAYSRAIVSRRNASANRNEMNRLYVVEPTPSITGTIADHRIPLQGALIGAFGAEVETTGAGAAQLTPELRRQAEVIGRDLRAHPGACLVVPGEGQPAGVHALAHRLNTALGNVGTTVRYLPFRDPAGAGYVQTIGALADAIRRGRVETLLTLGGNPVFTAPADLEFAGLYQRVPRRLHLGMYLDHTGRASHWHVPEAHYLETWSDGIAYDGTPSIIQPLIAPLYEGRNAHELLSALAGRPGERSYDTVRRYWQGVDKAEGFEERWEKWLHDGVIPYTPPAAETPAAAVLEQGTPPPAAGGIELVFRPDPSLWDGRFINNEWLQELPRPYTKLTWDAPVYVSPATAAQMGLKNEDVVRLELRGRAVEAPVWLVPGQADGSFTVFLGGYAYPLRSLAQPGFERGLVVRALGRTHPLASTQMHQSMEGRDLVHSASNAAFAKNPELFRGAEQPNTQELSLYPKWPYQAHKWGMMVDQSACIGCNACVVACMSENNVPTVGKEQVRRGREMHWLRIDHYHKGAPNRPGSLLQPVLCMHCENAPCEPVCPVAATVHSGEGLNQMVYNRCVGTRYCSNNCPYKVRRFNFLLYSKWDQPELDLLRNPDVTVRSRGVMEKCTYCVQRIESAKISAEREGRPMRDGDVVTACQAACPTRVFVFGDLNDPASKVSALARNPLSYSLLPELNTQPRTRYLARLTNPNAELPEES